jgi:hypothetical protein
MNLESDKCELRAVYVAPALLAEASGGPRIAEIERIAWGHKVDFLQLDSSLTAEPFYLHTCDLVTWIGVPHSGIRLRDGMCQDGKECVTPPSKAGG